MHPTPHTCAGPVADALCLNAGYALAACQVAASPAEGVAMAQGVQRSGEALRTLDRWVAVSKELAAREAKGVGAGAGANGVAAAAKA